MIEEVDGWDEPLNAGRSGVHTPEANSAQRPNMIGFYGRN